MIGWLVDEFVHETVFRKLMKSQWERPALIQQISMKKLQALLKHSYNNVSYYHKIFKERNLDPKNIKSTQDLQKLPILTKSDIKENFTKLTAVNFPLKRLIPGSTGGSTGEPVKFLNDRNSLVWINAAVLRSFYWAGYRRFNKLVNVWGFPENSVSIKPWQRQLTISTFGADDAKMKYFLDLIKKFKPKGIRGYASSLYLLARLTDYMNLSFVISTSEMLFEHYRKLIEEKFNCEVYDNYSGREFMIASECEEHNGYHIAAENLIVEFVRDDEHVSPGEFGEILITDLTRYGMPLIRYQVGDVGRASDAACSCGRGLPLIKSIEGRVTDFIWTPSGKFVSSPAVTLLFKDMDVKQYQVVQESKEKLVIKIVKGLNYSEKDTHFILSNFRKYIDDMVIKVEFTDEIPPTKSGKRRVVISEISRFT